MGSPLINVQIAGLHTSLNLFSSAPPGSLFKADNLVINYTNVAESRRGFEALPYTFGTGSDRASSLGIYQDTYLVQYGTKLAYDTGSAFSDYSGTYIPVDETKSRMQFIGAAGNCYFSTTTGTKVLTAVGNTPADAGVAQPLRTFSFNDSASTWMNPDTSVAYRAVFGIIDEQGNEKLSAPSGRYVLRNIIISKAGQMNRSGSTVTVGTGLDVAHSLQVGDVVTMGTGEANFAAGNKTVASVPTPWSFTYTEAGVAAFSTDAHEFDIARSSIVWVYIPSGAGITDSHFVSLYRSKIATTADAEPEDEMFLVRQQKLTSANISAGFVSITDDTPQEFLFQVADPLYTNENSGETILQANNQPPIGLSMDYWDDRLWFGNTTSKHRYFLELLGVGSPDGAQVDDTLTIAGQTYTFKAAAANNTQFSLFTYSDSVAVNIERTANEMVRRINANTSNTTVWAYYVSGVNETRGRIMIEERAIGGAAFTVTASRKASFNPALPGTSDNNHAQNGLMYSKPQLPWAVPVVNQVLVGTRNSPITRIKGLKDKLYVFKDEGIFVVSGPAPYRVDQIAVTKLLAADSVQALSDRLFAFTDQGVVTISDGGVTVASRAIESDIAPLFGSPLDALKQYAFAVGYESDRRYTCWTPEASTDTTGTQAFNFSTSTNTWTRWTKAATCGLINPATDRLVIGSGTANQVLVERKDFARTDYADESFAVTVVSQAGNVLTLSSVAGITAGDVLEQGDNSVIVESVNELAATVTMANTATWSAGAATVYTAISNELVWNPLTAGNPSSKKQWSECTFLFKTTAMLSASGTFTSDAVASTSTLPITFSTWGASWGETPWGAPSKKLARVAPLPLDHQLAAQLSIGLNVREANSQWQLQGVVVQAADAGTGTRE